MGVWIEIGASVSNCLCRAVAPYAGAWIESVSVVSVVYKPFYVREKLLFFSVC